MRFTAAILMASLIAGSATAAVSPSASSQAGYGNLLALFKDWREFEKPPLRNGAPDYTLASLARQHEQLRAYQVRLASIDPSEWPIAQHVDYQILRAEMNGLDFNYRVLKPWERDPAFYKTLWTEQSDTPAHEGPTHHAVVELWTYTFPLAPEAELRLASQLAVIPPLFDQARTNLIGNARDLWIAGTGTLQQQVADLAALDKQTKGASAPLRRSVKEAHEATVALVRWLEEETPRKNGPSGIGKDNYSWGLRNVHLVPLSWEDEVAILKRELARAHASLKLEEQRNRKLPPMPVIQTAEEFEKRAQAGVTQFIKFLRNREIVTVRKYMDPALREQRGGFVAEQDRHFFHIATHLEPMTLYTHFYHWFDLARMRDDPHPSPIRSGPLLYNIWDSRAEGMATAMEEIAMHAGLYDDNPRAREIVWIMLAQRAARGLGSLYAQANIFTMKQAADFQVAWTPRGWMREDLDLLGFEQQLYLRQPGYGTSYVTGKHQIEALMKDYAQERGKEFQMREFFDTLDEAGMIPVSLLRWQLTGLDDEIKALLR